MARFWGAPFKVMAGMVLEGCWGEVGEVRVWMWVFVQSRAGGLGFGPKYQNRAVVARFGVRCTQGPLRLGSTPVDQSWRPTPTGLG